MNRHITRESNNMRDNEQFFMGLEPITGKTIPLSRFRSTLNGGISPLKGAKICTFSRHFSYRYIIQFVRMKNSVLQSCYDRYKETFVKSNVKN
mgnify:CR=1 FL=1